MTGRRILTLLLALLGSASLLRAQFETGGGDPPGLRWNQLETPHFRLLFPEDGGYLADEYARALEQYRDSTGASLGMVPGSLQWGKTPVLLHSRAAISNGAVTWAPKRMDLYTLPDPYSSEALPWTLQLAIHEQRHLAQMQFGYRGWLFRPLTWLFGEMVPGALAGIYPGLALLEGDAVVAETALSNSGRGRSGDFLTYYQVAYDEGDWRNWYRWRYGSFRDEAPDHYALGYETIAGARVFFGDTLFMQRYFDGVTRHPLRIGRFRRMLKRDAGTSFRAAFRQIQEGFQAEWAADRAARGPFMPMRQLTATPRFATDYGEGIALDGLFYAIKSGKVTPPTLVRIDTEGREEELHPMAAQCGYLHADTVLRRLYWSETVPDLRWSLGGTSRIRYFSTEDGKIHDLTRKGRLYNPVASPGDGSVVAAVSYPYEGGSEVCFFRVSDGSCFQTIPGPAGVQLTEIIWEPDGLYALGLSREGFAIWRSDGRKLWDRISEPIPAKMHTIGGGDGVITFVSDLGGVNELYSYDIRSGELLRQTNTPYGATDYESDGKNLVFAAMTPKGMGLFLTPVDSLQPKAVSFSDRHAWGVADALSAQERALSFPADTAAVPFDAAPRPYRKAPHLLHIHSWAPFAIDYDRLSGDSGDFVRDNAEIGATLFLQNTFGDCYGFANYSWHPDDLTGITRRHSFHAQLSYSGLYPVLQGRIAVNDRGRLHFFRQESDVFGVPSASNGAYILDEPVIQGLLKAYVPLNLSKGGWTRGVIPQLSWTVSNDYFSRERLFFRYKGLYEDFFSFREFTGSVRDGRNVLMQTLSASLRAYSFRPAASSQTYPSLGIGAEIGGFFRPGLSDYFTPNLYAYVYGYLPGILPEQGVRLSAMLQRELSGDNAIREGHLNLQPRGMGSVVGLWMGRNFGTVARFTADYAIPFSLGDISFLSPITYITHFTLTPHADLSWCGGKNNLYSIGADFTANLANFLWMPFGGSFGFTVDYNGGSLFPQITAPGSSHWSADVIFSLDF